MTLSLTYKREPDRAKLNHRVKYTHFFGKFSSADATHAHNRLIALHDH